MKESRRNIQFTQKGFVNSSAIEFDTQNTDDICIEHLQSKFLYMFFLKWWYISKQLIKIILRYI